MQFLITLGLDTTKAKGPPPKALAEEEFDAVRRLYMDGILRQIWVHADGSGAVILAEANSADAAGEAFSRLPLVREGLFHAPKIVPLAPYFGFAPSV